MPRWRHEPRQLRPPAHAFVERARIRRRGDAEVVEDGGHHLDDRRRQRRRARPSSIGISESPASERPVRAAAGSGGVRRGRRTPSPPRRRRSARPHSGSRARPPRAQGRRDGRAATTSPSAPPRRAQRRRVAVAPGRTTSTAGLPSSRRARIAAVVVRVDHPGTVRRRHERVGERVLQPRHVVHRRLAVVGAEDDGVALEELVRPAGRLDQRADGVVAARERLRAPRPGPVRARRSRSRRGRRRGSRSRRG